MTWRQIKREIKAAPGEAFGCIVFFFLLPVVTWFWLVVL